MSKRNEAKERQGWLKQGPNCSNCKALEFETVTRHDPWGGKWTKSINIRCGKGSFKTGKSSWCKEYEVR